MPRIQQIVRDLFDGAAQGREPQRSGRGGAAVQGGVLGGEVKDVLLLDVTRLFAGHRDDGRRVRETD